MINRRGMTVAKAAIAYADAKGVATLAEGEERDRFFEAEAPKLRAAGDHVQAERFEKEVGLHHKLAIDAVANSVLLPLLREGRLMIEGFPRGRTELALMPPEMVHDICNLDASGKVLVGFHGERGRWVALRIVDPVEAPAAIIVARAVELAAPVMPDVHVPPSRPGTANRLSTAMVESWYHAQVAAFRIEPALVEPKDIPSERADKEALKNAHPKHLWTWDTGCTEALLRARRRVWGEDKIAQKSKRKK